MLKCLHLINCLGKNEGEMKYDSVLNFLKMLWIIGGFIIAMALLDIMNLIVLQPTYWVAPVMIIFRNLLFSLLFFVWTIIDVNITKGNRKNYY